MQKLKNPSPTFLYQIPSVPSVPYYFSNAKSDSGENQQNDCQNCPTNDPNSPAAELRQQRFFQNRCDQFLGGGDVSGLKNNKKHFKKLIMFIKIFYKF